MAAKVTGDILIGLALAGVPALGSDGRWFSLAVIVCAAAWRRHFRLGMVLAAYWVPTALGLPWPSSCLILAVAWALLRAPAIEPGSLTSLDRRAFAPSVAIGLLAGILVLVLGSEQIIGALWFPAARPATAILVTVAVLAAIANAFGEECVWRGFLPSCTRGGGTVWQIAVVSGSFGLAHFAGIPGGAVGMVASCAYAVALTWMRIRWGFAIALAAHLATDLVFFIPIAISAGFAFATG